METEGVRVMQDTIEQIEEKLKTLRNSFDDLSSMAYQVELRNIAGKTNGLKNAVMAGKVCGLQDELITALKVKVAGLEAELTALKEDYLELEDGAIADDVLLCSLKSRVARLVEGRDDERTKTDD